MHVRMFTSDEGCEPFVAVGVPAAIALAVLAARSASQGSLTARCSSMRSLIDCTVSVGSSYCA